MLVLGLTQKLLHPLSLVHLDQIVQQVNEVGSIPGGPDAPKFEEGCPVLARGAQPQRPGLVLHHLILVIDKVGALVDGEFRVTEVALRHHVHTPVINQVLNDFWLLVCTCDIEERPVEHGL